MKIERREEQGFTLMEMLIVLFIIGVIIAIALPNLKSAGERARDKADLANRRMIGSQADNFYLEHGRYPKSVQELVKHGYLREVPSCPGGKGRYVIHGGGQIPAQQRVSCR